MASRDIVTRTGKGSALSASNYDQNVNSTASTVDTQTGATYTVLYTDQGKVITLNNASMTCSMDDIATIAAAIDTDNWAVTLVNINAADATVDSAGSDTFDGAADITLIQYEAVTLTNHTATDWLVVSNNGLPRIDAIESDITDLQAVDVITTRGDIIRGDSSGDPERLAVGAAGEVLTSDGTDADWALPGTWTYLDTFDAAAATLGENTSIPADVTGLKFVFDDVSLSAGTSIFMQLGDTVGYSATFTNAYSNITASGTLSSGIGLTVAAAAADADEFLGVVEFTKLDGSHKWIGIGTLSSVAGTKIAYTSNHSVTMDNSTRVTRVKIWVATGAFDAGSVDVFTR